jgi:hypothetical protein
MIFIFPFFLVGDFLSALRSFRNISSSFEVALKLIEVSRAYVQSFDGILKENVRFPRDFLLVRCTKIEKAHR